MEVGFIDAELGKVLIDGTAAPPVGRVQRRRSPVIKLVVHDLPILLRPPPDLLVPIDEVVLLICSRARTGQDPPLAAHSAEFETIPQRRRKPPKCGEGIGFALPGEAMAVC